MITNKKFIVAGVSTMAVLVASYAGQSVTEVSAATPDIFLGKQENGKWVQTGAPITGFDFSKFESELRDSGTRNNMVLSNVNVQLHDLNTGSVIDFGSFANFNKNAKDQIKTDSEYEFQLQGVYKVFGESTSDDTVVTPYARTGYVLVTPTQNNNGGGTVTPPTPPTDGGGTVTPPDSGNGDNTKPPTSGGGSGDNNTSPPTSGGSGSGDSSDNNTTPPTPPTDKPDIDKPIIKPPSSDNPAEVKPPISVTPDGKPGVGDKVVLMSDEYLEVDIQVGIQERKTGKTDVVIGVTPKVSMQEVDLVVTAVDKTTRKEDVYREYLGNIDANKLIETNLAMKDTDNKIYLVNIETSKKNHDGGHFLVVPLFKYKDVSVNAGYHDDIYLARDLNISFGSKNKDGDWYYKPNDSITRAQALVMVLRSLGIEYEGYKGKNNFQDTKGLWYEDAVAKGFELGITEGYTDTEFRGDETISREHLAAFFARAYVKDYKNSQQKFEDVGKERWTYDHVNTMAELGVIHGYENSLFKPKSKATRAQATQMILRVLRSDSSNVDLDMYKEVSSISKLDSVSLKYSISESNEYLYADSINPIQYGLL